MGDHLGHNDKKEDIDEEGENKEGGGDDAKIKTWGWVNPKCNAEDVHVDGHHGDNDKEEDERKKIRIRIR